MSNAETVAFGQQQHQSKHPHETGLNSDKKIWREYRNFIIVIVTLRSPTRSDTIVGEAERFRGIKRAVVCEGERFARSHACFLDTHALSNVATVGASLERRAEAEGGGGGRRRRAEADWAAVSMAAAETAVVARVVVAMEEEETGMKGRRG